MAQRINYENDLYTKLNIKDAMCCLRVADMNFKQLLR